MGIKRKFFLGALALELATLPLALPAFAGLAHKVSFEVKPIAIVKTMTPSAGEQSFLVASNAPFAVISENAVTDMTVTITQNGTIDGQAFGASAQLAGPKQVCNIPARGSQPSRIYTAQSKTAGKRGSQLEQSVLVTVSYDPALTPSFNIRTMDSLSGQSVLLALPCDLDAQA